jgi:hypothetical protein
MVATAGELLLGLDLETERRIHDLFMGKRCCQCARSAVRLFGRHYYCDDHFPQNSLKAIRWPKVYRAAITTR